jgi:hypothetical protein
MVISKSITQVFPAPTGKKYDWAILKKSFHMGRLLWFIVLLFSFFPRRPFPGGKKPSKKNRLIIADPNPLLPAGHLCEFDSAMSFLSKLVFLKNGNLDSKKDLKDV